MTTAPIHKCIRVFPHRTKWTPTDATAFVGEPPEPLLIPQGLPVRVSALFTWDVLAAVKLAREWRFYCADVRYGGPGFGDPGGEFEPGCFVRPGVTITSRGCPKHCPWCLVPGREGKLREVEIKDGWIIQDNNLLACSRNHIENVFEMLGRQRIPASFPGGLDLDYLDDWHVELLHQIRVAAIWVAFDTPASLSNLSKAKELLAEFGIERRRAYVLINFNGETLCEAEKRLERVYDAGFLPFAMLYRGERTSKPIAAWRDLQRKWTRPAIYRSTTKNDG